MCSYSVEFHHWQLMGTPEGNNYVIDIDGKILEYDSKTERSRQIGKLHGNLIHVVEAEERGESVLDVFDAKSQPLYEVGAAIWDQRQGFYKESLGLESDYGDALFIDSIKLKPGARGKNIGLLAAACFIRTFASECAVVVLKPYPLQYSLCFDKGRIGRPLPSVYGDMSLARGQAKLRAHWAKLGTKKIRGSDYYFIDPVRFRLEVDLEDFVPLEES